MHHFTLYKKKTSPNYFALAYCLLCMAMLAPPTLTAQPFYFRHYQVENGLSNNTVFCSAQDNKGFMWFGTKDGLSRFDGYHFKVFHIGNKKPSQSFAPDYVLNLFVDKVGILWVGAERGLYKYNAEKESLEPFIDSLHYIWDIEKDKHGQLWFLSDNTVYRYNFSSGALKKFPPTENFGFTSICLSNDGTIYASTTNGFLERFNESSESFKGFDVFAHSPHATSEWISTIKAGDKNSIFIGTSSQGLKRFDEASLTYTDVLTYNPDKTTIFVRDILKNSADEFWIATESGIFDLNTNTWKYINIKKKLFSPYSLNDNAVYTLCKDEEGGIWAGTYFGGVNYYAKQNAVFKKYLPDNTQSALGGNVVREICEDQFNNLWIGTEDGGLNKLNKEDGSVTHFIPTAEKTSIAYTNIHGLLAVGNDLWIGTFEHGIDVMDIRTGKVKKHFVAGPGAKQLKSNFGLCFLRTTSGEILTGTSNGLFYYKKDNDEFEKPKEVTGNFFISALLQDHNGTIWVGTHDHGVFWFNRTTGEQGIVESHNNQAGLENKTINDIYEDSDNSIWFATEGSGLCMLSNDRKKITWVTTRNGLPGNFVFKVLEDNNKNIWVSTSKGLISLKPDLKTLGVYTQANGLLNNQFNYHSGFKDADGRLYFGSVKGMISFMPNDFFARSFVPPVYLTGFQVFNKELTINDSSALKRSIVYTDKITLPYYQSSVSIDFAALSYIAPEMISYAYQLEGLDNSWTTITANRKVYFTNLSPARYAFKLKANANGVWSKEKKLIIEILPPFWATGWAYLLYAILAILLFYYLLTNYHKRQQNKKEKEIYESKIEFFTNVVHEIRTPLTLIKGPVENLMEKEFDTPDIKEDIACLDRNTNRLMNLVTQLLDFRQTEIKGFSLYFTRVNVNEILKETSLSFNIMAKKRKVEYNVIIPPNDIYAFADGEALRKIFSNLVSNAVKYADKKVTVRLCPLEKNVGTFTIEFENDGYILSPEQEVIIFKPFQRLKETHNQKGTGIGLTLARSLAELQTGKLYMKFNKKAINTFVLTLPLKHEQESRVSATLK